MVASLSLKRLYRDYVKALPNMGVREWSGRPDWTRYVLAYWQQLGRQQGYTVYVRGDPIEYLVDLCWKYEPPRGQVWMQLALESEWNPHENAVLEDFYKLIDIKANQKVFLFQPPDEDKRLEYAEWLAGEVERCPLRLPNESYLLISHGDKWEDEILIERLQGFSVDSSGNMRALGEPIEVTIG